MSLYFQYNPEENNSADAQSRILGLIEILSEQLNRVNGINIAEYNQLTGKAANQAELLPVNSVLINLSLQVNDNNSYNLEYQITNQKNHEKIQSKVHWIDFLDISWISNKILSQVLSVILGKRITLLAPNQELMDNARAYQFFSHGLYQYNEQNYSTAVKEFNEALKINPFFTQAHYYKGLSLFQIQEFKQAETAFFESLPEVKKNKFIEWQISISDSIDKPIYLMNALIDNRSSNYFFAYNPEFLDKLLLIDVEKKVKCYLNFPNTPVFLYHIHYDSGKFLFIIRNKNNPKLSIWGYDPKNKKWDYLIDIKNYYDIFLHYILIENDSTNILSWIDIQKADKVDTIYLKHKLYNRSKVYPTSDPNKFILENTNNIYLVDAHEKSAKYLNDLLPEFSKISKAVFGLKDYLIFPTSAEHFLNMYNITQNKIQFQFPLLYSEKFGLINNGSSSAFTIEESTNRILVKEPDSLLHLYQLTENGTIKSISSFNITNYDGNFQLTDNPFNKSPSSEILLCDKNTGEFLFANPKNNDIEIIHLNERILSTYFLSTNFLNISTQNRKVFMDVSKRKIAWEVDRTPDLSFYYLPERNTIFLYNYKEGKLLNFDLASMEISGSYNLFTTTQAYLTFVRSKLVYLEKNMVKVLNLNKMVDKNPINISGIYQKIAECEYQLGNHDKALEYVTRILKDFQPNRKSILLLQAKIIDHKYGYKKSISFLPLLYNTQPNGNLSRKMIENEFYRSGIYRWEQIVGIDRGYRILEATENKILCTGSISSIENKFWILRSIDGSILNNIPYKYCFNALLIPPDDLFYSESENYGGQLSYYLRKITDDQITKEYRQNQTTYFKPKLYQYGKNSIISFFAKTSNSPGFIQLINLKEKDVHEIYHSLDRKCEPLIKGNHLYFISGNTCFTVNLTNYELTSKYLDLLSTKPIHILGVIDIEPDQKTWLVNIKNVCYKLNINKSSLKLVEKISDYFQNIGYVSSKNVVRIFQDSANFSFQLPNDIKVEDMAISGNKVYVLQSDRLLVWKEGKIINTYPLLWSAIKFTIQNDTAYVLSSMGKIYAVNLNWTVDKLKKHLILSLN
ncbi:MAG: tetratricopeptide repeat protein [Calditrichota bacterium]